MTVSFLSLAEAWWVLGLTVLEGMANLPVCSYCFWNFVLFRSWGSRGRPAVLPVMFWLTETVDCHVHFSHGSTLEYAAAYSEPQAKPGTSPWSRE